MAVTSVPTKPEAKHYDVVIVGGAVIGSSVAYWLTNNPDFMGSVLVIERDWSYQHASTSLSAGAIRQQYSNPINVKISQFGIEFIKHFEQNVQVNGESPDISLRENGYLFVADQSRAHILREKYDIQHSLGAGTVLLTPEQMLDKFPYLNVTDLELGSWGSFDEGWFDPNALMQGFRRRARHNGASYINNELVDINHNGTNVQSVVLASGEVVSCDYLINAAGPRCATIANLCGLELPVEPRKRCTFVFKSQKQIPKRMPNIIDITGVWCRPEGEYFMAAVYPEYDPEVEIDDFDVVHEQFEDYIWPSLAHRIPQFEAIKVVNSWAGHYAHCCLDHNAIIGPHNEMKNFIFANGYSGHGLQQSPAVGRGLSELIIHGEYQSLDLSPLAYDRVVTNTPFLEQALI